MSLAPLVNKPLPGRNEDLIIYPSAGMSGLPDHNYPWFRYITLLLRQRGYTVIPPHEVNHGGNGRFNAAYEYPDYIRDDIFKALINCNAIVMGPGWTQSRGALTEFNFAANTGYYIFFWNQANEEMIRMDQWIGAPDGAASSKGTYIMPEFIGHGPAGYEPLSSRNEPCDNG